MRASVYIAGCAWVGVVDVLVVIVGVGRGVVEVEVVDAGVVEVEVKEVVEENKVIDVVEGVVVVVVEVVDAVVGVGVVGEEEVDILRLVLVSRGGLYMQEVVGVVVWEVEVGRRLVLDSRGDLSLLKEVVVGGVAGEEVVLMVVMVSSGGLFLALVARFLHRPYLDHIGRLFVCVATCFGVLVGVWLGMEGHVVAFEALGCLAFDIMPECSGTGSTHSSM